MCARITGPLLPSAEKRPSVRALRSSCWWLRPSPSSQLCTLSTLNVYGTITCCLLAQSLILHVFYKAGLVKVLAPRTSGMNENLYGVITLDPCFGPWQIDHICCCVSVRRVASSFSDSPIRCDTTVFAGACNMLDPSDIASDTDTDECGARV